MKLKLLIKLATDITNTTVSIDLIYPDRPDLVRLALGRLLVLCMHEWLSMQRRERVRVEGRSRHQAMNLVVKVCVAEVQGSVLDAEYAYPHGRSELQASVKWCNFIIIFIFMFYSARESRTHTHTQLYMCVFLCVTSDCMCECTWVVFFSCVVTCWSIIVFS